MKTCEKCKKNFEDDMNYCPYCGEKYHDYHEDLKNAMDDLFNEETKVKKDQPEPNHFQSKIEKVKKTKEEQENNILNKILFVLLVVLIVVFLISGYLFAKKVFFPVKEPVISDEKPKDETEDLPDKNEEDEDLPVEKPVENPDSTENPDSKPDLINEDLKGKNVSITAIQVTESGDQIRIDITCDAQKNGDIYLTDSSQLNVGPIKLHKGNNHFYFQLNPRENVEYKLTFDYGNEKDEMILTYDQLMNH